jgi:hypothetical protein
MKYLIIALLLAGGVITLSTIEASALVCARGVHRAGCVTAGGTAVVGHARYGYAARRGVVVRGAYRR